jgi:hypothetical protein
MGGNHPRSGQNLPSFVDEKKVQDHTLQVMASAIPDTECDLPLPEPRFLELDGLNYDLVVTQPENRFGSVLGGSQWGGWGWVARKFYIAGWFLGPQVQR